MSTYLESDAVIAAKKKVQDHESQRPVYTSRWEQQLSATLDKLQGRQFAYDLAADPAYESYRRAYTRKGKLAMADTLGHATALTGGYGNSYALTAAQQRYDGYMQELTDKIPQLYALAQERYDQETDRLNQSYQQYLALESQDRDSFDDAFDNWLKELQLLQQEQQAIAKEDYDRFEAEREWAEEHPQGSQSSGSQSSSSQKGYDNGSVSVEHIKLLQAHFGVTVDGKWGPESVKASGGLDADTAWTNYACEVM